mmetsp:Transcript_29529/g.60372  ORF Transcript_29529/g.60372 Transcript_29529/m.60372 type:complete len:772 (+) Transcript_29529:124-2439(+)
MASMISSFATWFTDKFFSAAHYFSVIPQHALRTQWISRKIQFSDKATLGCIAATGGINLTNIERSLDVVIKPKAICGVCGKTTGEYEADGTARVYCPEGPKSGLVFVYRCGEPSCGARCGVTTCTLPPTRLHGEQRQVLSDFIPNSDFHLPNLKPHERPDQRVAFSTILLESFTNDAVTIKSFEGWATTYNKNVALANQRAPVPLLGADLNVNTFRSAWFLHYAWLNGMALGLLPENCALFTKREADGDGHLERFIEMLNPRQAAAFTKKWVVHPSCDCGIEHKLLVSDGHIKIKTFCCPSKNATTMHHPALGTVHLACGRWPLYIGGKKQLLCAPCSIDNVVVDTDEASGDTQAGSTAAIAETLSDYPTLSIDAQDTAAVSSKWHDLEDGQNYILLGVTWMNVDSTEGLKVPELIGFYCKDDDEKRRALVGTDPKEMFQKGCLWSRMTEVRTWIVEEGKKVGMTDRAARKMRRDAQQAANEKQPKQSEKRTSNQSAAAEEPQPTHHLSTDNEATTEERIHSHRQGWALEDIHSRVVHFNGDIYYEVSYVVRSDTVRIWEPESAVPKGAIDRWLARRVAFRYSDDEKELMKKCAGSLKENQPKRVSTSAGILATILNCGIIVSITSLYGAESLSQVYMHLVDLYEVHGDYLPNNLAYDDGCHLRRFVELRKDLFDMAKRFWDKVACRIVVDRFHWKNHVKGHEYCQEHCNPYENKDIEGANSEICEQSFRWFARHKYSVNHMSPARFRFFMLIIADKRNEVIIEMRKKKTK